MGQSFASETFNKIIEYDFESREMALEYLAAIEMRLFQSIPAGKLRVTMFDPLDLGKNFAMFSVLGEHESESFPQRSGMKQIRNERKAGRAGFADLTCNTGLFKGRVSEYC